MMHAAIIEDVWEENVIHERRKGTSKNVRPFGFSPAFLDRDDNRIYLSLTANGNLAPIHMQDGLPRGLFVEFDSQGKPLVLKSSVISGFEPLLSMFFTTKIPSI